ncbi:MAG: hypothetical protein PUD92_04935 [Clostridiales bacterium]|nr:hypothetical protein [Clostridiales bacterium]
MFIKYYNNAVRLIGRWYKNGNAATAIACGSKIDFHFTEAWQSFTLI